MNDVVTLGTPLLYAGFFALVAVMLLVDFFTFKQGTAGEKVSLKQAGLWSAIWVGVSALFAGWLWWHVNGLHGEALANQKTIEFVTGYLLEKSLAIDNVFVWLLIFSAFAIPPEIGRAHV